MLKHIKDAFIDKLEETRDQEPYCTVRWTDTKKFEIIPQRIIRFQPSHHPELNVTYTIFVDDQRRHGTVLAKGTKKECEVVLYKLSPDNRRGRVEDSSTNESDFVDDLLLMRILGKILNTTKSDDNCDGEDIHDVECASCRMKPIRQVDRYRCLECSLTTDYDLCGRCFDKRCETGKHLSGHPMIHFKLPNESLGIHMNKDINLDKIKQLRTLRCELHDGITCDGDCKQTNFIGLRFKCDTCPNYNLCEKCALQKHVLTKSHRSNHPLVLTSDKVIPKIDSNDIELDDVLGRGAFGYVCRAMWRSKNRQVACKIIEVSGATSTSKQLQRSFLLELAAYRELSGSYILRTFAYATRVLPSNRVRGPTTQFMILMELMGRGSLQNLLNNHPNEISLRRKLTMSRQIASGMRRIHEHGMIHRDIRPDNILVNDNYIAKIGDMGIARVLDPNGQQTQMGCIQFMPPEFFDDSSDGQVKCDEKLDIYTYGLTLNQLFTEINHEFRLNSHSSRITITKQSPVFYDEIIIKCLDNDSKRRPTALDIEKTLELYEKTFSETMISDNYIKMNTKQKDRVFLDFYQKNKLKIRQFVNEQFPQKLVKEIPIRFSHKQKQSVPISNQDQENDPCRLS